MPTIIIIIIIFIITAFSFFLSFFDVTYSYGHTWKKGKWSQRSDSMNQLLFSSCAAPLLTGWLPRKTLPSSTARESVSVFKNTRFLNGSIVHFEFVIVIFLCWVTGKIRTSLFLRSTSSFQLCLIPVFLHFTFPPGEAKKTHVSHHASIVPFTLIPIPDSVQLQASSIACGTGPVSPGGGAAESQVASLCVCACVCGKQPWMTSPPGRMAPAAWTTDLCSGRPRHG